MNLKKWFKKDKQYKHEGIREYDFEGRCVKCHKRLNLQLTRVDSKCIKLRVISCEKHPEDSLILWPQREDIIHE